MILVVLASRLSRRVSAYQFRVGVEFTNFLTANVLNGNGVSSVEVSPLLLGLILARPTG